ncbi:MAG: hypothetical protein SFW67_29040 [Myxococcaceae bacterium]|nr:hypothetical protein [Myxococcaceae bacterium]
MRWAIGVLLMGCVAPIQSVKPSCPPCAEPSGAEPADAVRAAARAFVSAAEARDFATAWSWLSGAWRDRYTPERLARDFDREPRGAGFVSRLKASLGGPVSLAGDRATISLGAERSARLVLEPGGWKLDSLDTAAR